MAQSSRRNEFCLNSSRSPVQFLNSDVIFQSSSQGSPHHDRVACHRSLIYFLGMVQALELDFLPITWQPENGLIARGGTSEIHHALLGQDLSLAFKTISIGGPTQVRSEEDQEAVMSLMMAEIRHMSDKHLLESPYILTVEGICWSPHGRTGAADPVLVYERAFHGDLHSFMVTGQGKSMSFMDRVQVCRDIARGLERLHFCKVVHGDVKPQNVLMVNLDGRAVPKIADFGYSVAYTGVDVLIPVSRTVPWHAPELTKHNKQLVYQDAVRTDVFSFGMLCLWMLFAEELSEDFCLGLDFTDHQAHSEHATFAKFNTIEGLKLGNSLPIACKKFINTLELRSYQKDSLTKLFESTLQESPAGRVSNFQSLWDCLNDTLADKGTQDMSVFNLQAPSQLRQEQHFEFEIAESLVQLVQADIWVGEHILKALLEEACNATCDKCRVNAAFQVSICFTIGFGVSANKSSAQEYLRLSGRSADDLERQIQRMSNWYEVDGPHLYHTHFLNNLHREGFLRNIYTSTYMPSLSMETVKLRFQKISQDLEESLGAGSLISLKLNMRYAMALKDAGNYEEAAKLERNCIHYLESSSTFGIDSLDTQAVMYDLANTYRYQAKFEEAEQYNKKVLASRTKLFGKDHPLTLSCLRLEALLLQERGFFLEAEKQYTTLIPQLRSALGRSHPGTLNAMTDLGRLLIDVGRTEEALELFKEDVEFTERTLGPYNHATLTSTNNLASLYNEQEDFVNARKFLDTLAFRLRQTLGNDHVLTCTVMANQGSVYFKLGKYGESLSIFDEVISSLESLMGSQHALTLKTIRSKALVLDEMGEDSERIRVTLQGCIEGLQELLGDFHYEVLMALQEYCLFLYRRELWDEAEDSYRTLIARQEKALGKYHVALVEPLSLLGGVLEELGNREAEDVHRRATAIASKNDGGRSALSWESKRNLALYLHHGNAENLNEVEAIFREILSAKRTAVDDASELFQALDDLKEVLIDLGNCEEAESVWREALEIRRLSRERDDITADELLEAVAMLAWIQHHSRKFSEAQEVYAECVAMSTSIYGEDGERTLDLAAKSAWNMELAGRNDESRRYIMEVLRKSKERHGIVSRLFLNVAGRAAAIYFRQGDRATAVFLSEGILENVSQVFEPESEEIRAAEANHAIYTSAVESKGCANDGLHGEIS